MYFLIWNNLYLFAFSVQYDQVPHSQCSLRETPKFLQNFNKKTEFKKKFDQYFCLLSAFVIQAWQSKVKTVTLLHKMACILYVKIPKNYVRNAIELT
jgi:hypothetical protein